MKIKNINLNGKQIPLSNLTIIVGPNGVGKTTLLKDLRNEFVQGAGQGTKWTSLIDDNSFEASLAEWDDWQKSLEVISGESYNDNRKVYADPKSVGRQNKPQRVREDDLSQLNQLISDKTGTTTGNTSVFKTPFRDQRSILLSVDDRFYLSQNSSGQHNVDTVNNIKPAPFLADNEEILRSMNSKMIKMFGKKIFSECRTASTFNLYVGDRIAKQPRRFNNSPPNFKRIADTFDKWIVDNSIVSLLDEGHGVRAASQVLYELETGSNKIVFIDEPELHLYPSAKYLLGQFIGYSTRTKKKQVILSTHDSDLLRGLIDSNSKTTIIRVNKDRSTNYIKGSEVRKTTPNEVLQCAFLDAAIVSEGVQDQYVYNGVFRFKKKLPEYSYQILGANGKETVSNDYYFFDALGIKYATILDFDALFHVSRKNRTIEKCLRNKNIPKAERDAVVQKIDSLNEFLKDKNDRKKGIRCSNLNGAQRHELLNVIDELEKYGIFISHLGELEDWVYSSKEESTSEAILNKYKSRNKTKYKELSNFAEKIAKYIERQFS